MWIVNIVRIPGTCWKAWIVACKEKKTVIRFCGTYSERIYGSFFIWKLCWYLHILAFSLPSMVLFRITGKKYTCFNTFLNSLIQIVKQLLLCTIIVSLSLFSNILLSGLLWSIFQRTFLTAKKFCGINIRFFAKSIFVK